MNTDIMGKAIMLSEFLENMEIYLSNWYLHVQTFPNLLVLSSLRTQLNIIASTNATSTTLKPSRSAPLRS